MSTCAVANEPVLVPEPPAARGTMCVRCREARATVVVRQTYCRTCFVTAVAHKFRAAFGKAHVAMRDETVVAAFSGGPSSLYARVLDGALLALLHANMHEENVGRRFNIDVVAVHIDESAVLPYPEGAREALRARATAYGLCFECIPLETAFLAAGAGTAVDGPMLAQARAELAEALVALRTVTAREDFVRQLRTHLLIAYARAHGHAKVLVGDNATRLAAYTLAETSRGRAAVLPLSIAFLQAHAATAASAPAVATLRPMRELLSKEVGLYAHFTGISAVVLPTLTTKAATARASIDHLTETFVVTLQKDFPSTVDALARTVEKMGLTAAGPPGTAAAVCVLCELPLARGARQWREAIVVRTAAPGAADRVPAAPIAAEAADLPGNDDATMDAFCYGCQTLLRERTLARARVLLPPYVVAGAAASAQQRRDALRAAIADTFLPDTTENDLET